MRRLANITKETALWARAKTVGINELEVAQRLTMDKDQFKELESIHSVIKQEVKNGVLKVLSYEVRQLMDNFNFKEEDLTAKGSAFPEVDCLDDSIIEYSVDLASDITELFTMPALDILDEMEDWLNELWKHHELKG